MEDEGRKQEILNLLDDLHAALEEFDKAVGADEMGARMAVALGRLRAAWARRQCELAELPDGSIKVFLDQAKTFEKQADKLERQIGARDAEAMMYSGRGEEHGGDGGEIEESPGSHVRATLKEHDECIQGLISNQETQASTNEHTLEILKELTARIERLEQNT